MGSESVESGGDDGERGGGLTVVGEGGGTGGRVVAMVGYLPVDSLGVPLRLG